MGKTFGIVMLLVLAGCAGTKPYQPEPSACLGGESTYECQIERYLNVDA